MPAHDNCYQPEYLNGITLVAMNGPRGAAGRFEAAVVITVVITVAVPGHVDPICTTISGVRDDAAALRN